MTGQRTLPGLGLTGFWDLGSNLWKDENDVNLRTLSAAVQLGVISATTALPGSPANGAIYIVPTSGGANAGKVAVRDNGAWVYITPQEGWLAYARDVNAYLSYDGAAWGPLIADSGEEESGIPEAPNDGKLYGRKDQAWSEIPASTALPTITFFVAGKTLANELVARFIAPVAITLKAAKVRASSAVAATASTTLTLKKNGTNAGTLVFAAAGTVPAITFTTDIVLAAGDVLSLHAPASPDATLADVTISLSGA